MVTDPIGVLEADLSEPIHDLIARAERRATPPEPGHLEFNITAHHGEWQNCRPEFYRLNGVHFIAEPGRTLTLAQTLDIPVPTAMDVVTLWVHEAASDIALFWTYPTGYRQALRGGDTIRFVPGSITMTLHQ